MLALQPGPSREFLRRLGARLGRPCAIVCISAHWETEAQGPPDAGPNSGGAHPSSRDSAAIACACSSEEVCVSLDPQPETVNDFYGFPPELYRARYPAPGDPEPGRRIVDLIPGARGVEKRGFDHGVWSPLMLMDPEASIPVVEISVQPRRDAAYHYAVGRALAPLREESVLILGSGSATHNLLEMGRSGPHVTEFENRICEAVEEGRAEDLVRYEELAPHAKRNHPTPEHLLPLFAPLGAANSAPGEVLNRVFEYASLSRAAFLWPR